MRLAADAAHGSAGRVVRREHGITLALRLPAEPAQIAVARRRARRVAERSGLSAARCFDVALAVGEACSNVVAHAYRDGRPGMFVMHVSGRSGRVEVVVVDDGCGPHPRPDSPGAGYGLQLIAAVASTHTVEPGPDGGTRVRMRFDEELRAD